MKYLAWAIGLAALLAVAPFLSADAAAASGGGAHGGGGYGGGGGYHGGGGYSGGGAPHGGYYGGGGYHGGYYGGTQVYIGGGWWGWPGWWGPGWGAPYPYPYPYSYSAPPVVIQPAPPTEYIQQPPPPQYWYYCSNPQGYYPYIQHCSVAWIPVLPQMAAAPTPVPPAPAPPAPNPPAPAPPAPLPAPGPPVDRLTLHITFDIDQAVIRPAEDAELQKALAFVKRYPGFKITIAGYTDNTGTASYNLGLSERRAAAVKAYLLQHGVPDTGQITTVGYGEAHPVASNATATGRAQNRRVEITVLAD